NIVEAPTVLPLGQGRWALLYSGGACSRDQAVARRMRATSWARAAGSTGRGVRTTGRSSTPARTRLGAGTAPRSGARASRAGADGVLAVRGAIEPRKGQLALPGGFVDLGESWQQAGARELREETGIVIDPGEIRDFRVLSAPDGTVLIFGVAGKRAARDLPRF